MMDLYYYEDTKLNFGKIKEDINQIVIVEVLRKAESHSVDQKEKLKQTLIFPKCSWSFTKKKNCVMHAYHRTTFTPKNITESRP